MLNPLFKKSAIFAVALTVSATPFAKGADKHGAEFLDTYAKIASANYSDSLNDAKDLQKAIEKLAKSPSEATLEHAKKAWLESRESYGQSEAFRLSNGPIDAEEGWVADAYQSLEGQLNAWPLDENLIDYTIDADGKTTTDNIISSKGKFTPGGELAIPVNIDKITPEVLSELNENGGDANVTSGYHAIEFLLWGQDQDYNNFIEDNVTKGALTAGQRPVTDFTTDAFAARRLEYLKAAADKLVSDLATVNSAWGKDGKYRQALTGELTGKSKNLNLPTQDALKDIFAGLGVFMKSELANERIAVAVLTPSEEDEHSCFSDNTHRDIVTNYQGFKNILTGEYNGKQYGFNALEALSKADRKSIEELMKKIEKRIDMVDSKAKTEMHFDYQIMPKNKAEVKNIVALKNDMRKLGDKMVTVAKAFGVNLTESDVTDAEETQL